jgi:Tol biopolymer transport system component
MLLAAGLAAVSILAAFAVFRLRGSSGKMATTAFRTPVISSLTSSGDVQVARISPDGRYLAYVVNRDGQYGLWVRQIANSSAVQVLPSGRDQLADITFTPDGNSLNYTALPPESGPARLFRIPLLGGAPRKILDSTYSAVTFSPDGQRMAFTQFEMSSAEVRLMIANADGSGVRQLTSRKASPSYGNYRVLHWSPDGSRIAALTVEERGPGGTLFGLSEIDASTGSEKPIPGPRWRAPKQVTRFTSGVIWDCHYSPDGKSVVLARGSNLTDVALFTNSK